mgnify:CR=1 FL=1
MRSFAAILSISLAVLLLLSCDQQQPGLEVDPQLGRDCFELKRAALPPGTQYEGIAEASAEMLTIRIMTGVDLATVECALNPDGTLRKGKE